MSTLASRLVFTGSLFLFMLLSGVWLSNSGKPYSTLIFTIHKLIALAAIIATAVIINYLHKTADLRLSVEFSAIIVTGLLFLSLLISGALLSIGRPATSMILTIHRVAPLLAVVSTAATIYLLASGR